MTASGPGPRFGPGRPPFGSGWAARLLKSLLAASLWSMPAARGLPAQVQASAYVDGHRIELPVDRLAASGLLALCEAQVDGADSVLRLGVSAQSIQALRRDAWVLEIVYPAPRRFASAAGGRGIEASRLLIPLSGELSGSVTTVFYGNPEYQAGPLRNRQGSDEIARLVKSLTARGP